MEKDEKGKFIKKELEAALEPCINVNIPVGPDDTLQVSDLILPRYTQLKILPDSFCGETFRIVVYFKMPEVVIKNAVYNILMDVADKISRNIEAYRESTGAEVLGIRPRASIIALCYQKDIVDVRAYFNVTTFKTQK